MISRVISLFGSETNISNQIYIVAIFLFLMFNLFLKSNSFKNSKFIVGVLAISLFYYIQFSVYDTDKLGSHRRLEMENLNSSIFSPNYQSNLYYLMGIKRCSSSKDIQFQFRKWSRMLHPDRKPNPSKLKKSNIYINFEGKFDKNCLRSMTTWVIL
jgi:hypothetical protein